MTEKKQGTGASGDARQVFRQFAWHLAGTLTQRKTARPGKPARPTARRATK